MRFTASKAALTTGHPFVRFVFFKQLLKQWHGGHDWAVYFYHLQCLPHTVELLLQLSIVFMWIRCSSKTASNGFMDTGADFRLYRRPTVLENAK